MPKVSVVIPTHNRANYIAHAVESVLDQTFRDYEIIVINDGSTDNTQEVLKKFEDKIKLLHQENKGIAQTRNRAIQESTGEYIAFLDSDDYWMPEKLDQQVRILDTHPKVGIVYSRMPIVDKQGNKIGMKPAGPSGRNFRELLEIWGDLPTSTVMVRRSCFEKAGLFDTALHTMEDIDMWIRIARFYDIYEIENKVLAFYRRHDHQVTNDKTKVYGGLVRIYKKIYDYPEAPRDLMSKRIVKNQYLLAKEYYLRRNYKAAFADAWGAILRYPLLGVLFFVKTDNFLIRFFKIMRPYGLFFVSFLKFLILGFKRKSA